MKISTRGEYGIRAMLELALINQGAKTITVKEIARRQGISDKYLEHLFSLLKKGGLVYSVRGARGGYRLARSPEEISLKDMILALDGPLLQVRFHADDHEYGLQYENCVLHEVWDEVRDAIGKSLDEITLDSMCRRVKKEQAQSYMF